MEQQKISIKSLEIKRCFDTPLSEDAMTGVGIGAALAGLRPIFVHQRMDFFVALYEPNNKYGS